MKNREKKKIAVIGGGSWATALVKILIDNNHRIKWWMRDHEAITFIKNYHRNPKYLSSVHLTLRRCKLYKNLRRVLATSDIIIIAIPAAFIKDTFSKIPTKRLIHREIWMLLKKKIIVSAVKGIVPDENLVVMDYFQNTYKVIPANYVLISGPCHAEEVAQEKLSYLTFSSSNDKNAAKIASLFKCRYTKTAVSNDVYGNEYAAVLKNIFAIASGISHGVGYGDNFQAVLMSNAIQEMKKFINTLHPLQRDIKSSSYLGDLLVTSYSQYSRNRTFGNMIGKGYSVKSAQIEMSMVAEGYYAVKSIHQLNKELKVDMPITEAVYNILYEQIAPALEMQLLADNLK